MIVIVIVVVVVAFFCCCEHGFVHVLLDPFNPTKEHTQKTLSLSSLGFWLWNHVLGLLTYLFLKQWILALTV